LVCYCLSRCLPWRKTARFRSPAKFNNPKARGKNLARFRCPRASRPSSRRATNANSGLPSARTRFFAYDKATLNPDAEQTLVALGPLIQKAGKHPISVEGHTDAVGTDAYNQGLSEKRAASVEGWLEAHKYTDPGTTAVRGFGKTRPVAPNKNSDGSDNPAGRQQNRRVEVVIDTCK
jgi:outer membrane protein OmpA-like peptidoglycan-associated protein